jgi:hypothetical protein
MSEVVFTSMDDFLARFGTDEEKKAAQVRLSMATTKKEESPATVNVKPEILLEKKQA